MINRNISFALIVLLLSALACNAPQAVPEGISTDEPLAETATPTSTNTPEGTALPTSTGVPSATACPPTVIANTSVNIRSGPGTVYTAIGALTTGASAPVIGKNADSSWWVISFPAGPGGQGWVSGSVVTGSCIPATLAIVAAPPTPLPASGTCKDDYVWRLIIPSDKVCVSPASKAQADADNAAAASRKATAIYGPDTCIDGYVWRDAFTNDHVCVLPAVRTQAAADNAAAASRWVVGAFGPHTCIAGFVWREAAVGDDVCVTPADRTQAAADNAVAASRKVTSLFGPDTCATGYVWREAFSGDHVCVTPTIRTQVAADNAAAPSHTWP